MPTRKAQAEWEGNLQEGGGRMKVESGAFEAPFGFKSRLEDGTGTNPEELIGAAHAGCFSMALASKLADAGYPPTHIHTNAAVTLKKGRAGLAISAIALDTEADVPGISVKQFRELAASAGKTCPVSKALAGTKISLKAKLIPAKGG